MQDVLFVEESGQAGAIFHPLRLDVLRRLSEPRSCPDLAKELAESTQKIYYHVKILERAGLVDKVEERRVRGIMEGLYRARARSYWLSPQLVGRVGGEGRARDQMSLGFLLTLAEEIQSDVAHLGESADKETPSLGLSAQIQLEDNNARVAFLTELQDIFQGLARKYGKQASSTDAEGQSFKLSLVCYPKQEGTNETDEK